MRQGEVVELEIPSSPEYVSIARMAVEGLAKRMPFAATQIEDLKVAVGEACTNAVRHGCPQEGGNVGVRCTVAVDGLLVEVRNNHSECEYPIVPSEPDLTKEGGFGLYLIKHLMDEVNIHWDKETAVVTMLMRLPPAAI